MTGTPAVSLNVFQRIIRQWEAVHPYNAAQAMHLRGQAGVSAWQHAWDDTLRAMRLGRAIVEDNRLTYQPPESSQPIDIVPPHVPLEQHVTVGMNQPFAEGDIPIRPFICQDDGTYHVGVVYQHWIADSVSIRMLLRQWFARVMDPSAVDPRPPRQPTGGYWRHFGPQRVPWELDQAVLDIVRTFSRFRSVRRISTAGSSDFAKRFITRTAPRGIVPALIRYSRSRGVTLNDLFLAAMMEQCVGHLPFRQTPRRQDLALGTIVDLRGSGDDALADVFGLFLGFTHTIVRGTDLSDFERMLRSIHAQSALSKQRYGAAAGTVWLGLSLIFGRRMPGPESYRFFRKHMPLAGGISNVNMNRTWAGKYHPNPLLGYVRASPTGPMIPVAFTPTTLGDDLQAAMTYRSALINPETAGRMLEGILTRLCQCAMI